MLEGLGYKGKTPVGKHQSFHIDGPSDEEMPVFPSIVDPSSSTVDQFSASEVYVHFYDKAVESFFEMIKSTTLIEPMRSRKTEDKFFEECREQARTYTFLPKSASGDASNAEDDDNDDDADEGDGDSSFCANAKTLAEGLTGIIESTATDTETKKENKMRFVKYSAGDDWIRARSYTEQIAQGILDGRANTGEVRSCLINLNVQSSASLDDIACRMREREPIVVGCAPVWTPATCMQWIASLLITMSTL